MPVLMIYGSDTTSDIHTHTHTHTYTHTHTHTHTHTYTHTYTHTHTYHTHTHTHTQTHTDFLDGHDFRYTHSGLNMCVCWSSVCRTCVLIICLSVCTHDLVSHYMSVCTDDVVCWSSVCRIRNQIDMSKENRCTRETKLHPIASRVSLNLNLQAQSPWSVFNGTW